MAKDPAVLFYTSDFLSSTITMTMEQKGKYITLLCIQHQQSFLTEEDFDTILSDKDKRVKDKFIKQSDGTYFNIKLKAESERRKAYTESRRSNRSKDKNNLSETYDKLMETVTVTDTVTETRNEILTKTITDTLSSIADKMKVKPSDKQIKELDNLV
jgi:flagellar motility protein MotE (MotC chaperone)